MANDPEKPKPESGDGEAFDAIKAAEELAASLGMSSEGETASGAEAYTLTLEKEIEQLNLLLDQKDVEVAQARAAADKAVAAHQAALGEVDKAAARIERELEKRNEQKFRKMLLAFIEINDNLDRAIDAASTSEAAETVLEGVELVSRAFDKKLADFGVTRVDAMDRPFDPNLHEAVSQLAVDDPAKDKTVVAVVLVGYTIGDELLRPAKVVVGKHAP